MAERAYPTIESRPTAEDISLGQLITPLAARWRLLVGLPLALGIFTGVVSLVLPPAYTGQTTLTPASSSPMGGLTGGALASLAGLAGALGMAAGGSGALSPDFIAEVLKSREVLTATLASRFRSRASGGQERPLLDILQVKGKTEARRISQGVRRLEKAVKTQVDHSTGIVTLKVRMGEPALAADVANRMREILNSFNLERRQSQSHEQARFTRERLNEAETELRQAEATQLRFLQSNREYRDSPVLEFEASRLQRAVDLKQEVYVSLAKAYDEARIAEVRDTPVITTIDSAVTPDRRSSPRPVLNGIIAFLAGGALAFVLIFLLEQRSRRMQSGSSPRDLSPASRIVEGRPAASARTSSSAEH